MENSRFTFIDLFSGIGGFHLGLEFFGGRCLLASEIDLETRKTYFNNHLLMPLGDVRDIPEDSVPDHDILCAGFPCQAFSVSGKQKGFEDKRGTLYFEVERIAKHKKPKVLFLENVKNFLNHNEGQTFQTVLDSLHALNYDVYYDVLNSYDFGLPQVRKRAYIVAFRKDLGVKDFKFPKKSELFVAKKISTINEVLQRLKPEEEKQLLIKRTDIFITKKDRQVKRINKPYQVGKINKGGQGERIYSRFAPGITLSAMGGGAGAKTGAYLIRGKIRRLHPKECLRMQGFPPRFKLSPKTSISYRQLGNAVSVPVVKAISLEILKCLQIQYQDSIDRQIFPEDPEIQMDHEQDFEPSSTKEKESHVIYKQEDQLSKIIDEKLDSLFPSPLDHSFGGSINAAINESWTQVKTIVENDIDDSFHFSIDESYLKIARKDFDPAIDGWQELPLY